MLIKVYDKNTNHNKIKVSLRTKDKLYVRAGGGIVADSQPEKETLETEAKANGMLKALNLINK